MAKSKARLLAELLSPTSSAHTPEGTAVDKAEEPTIQQVVEVSSETGPQIQVDD
jgi:hypothetical protein